MKCLYNCSRIITYCNKKFSVLYFAFVRLVYNLLYYNLDLKFVFKTFYVQNTELKLENSRTFQNRKISNANRTLEISSRPFNCLLVN